MPWALQASPLLLVLWAAWVVAGLALTRVALRLRDGVEVAALTLPTGLLAQVLLTNALAYVVGVRAAVALTLALALAGGFVALRQGPSAPLAWDMTHGTRALLLLAAVALGLGVWELGAREVFGDDGAHASMAHLLAAGEFPLRFQCNPALRAAYHYGGDLLAASVMVVAGAPPFEALDVARAACVTSVLMLAFLAGWRPRRCVGAGLLAALLLATVGPMLWIFAPLAHEGVAAVAGSVTELRPFVEALRTLLRDGWRFSVVTPGFITPTYGHAQRALAWGFAPFQVLLFLALLEAPLTRRRRSVALGLVLGLTPLMQTAVLALLLPALAWHVLSAWRRHRRGQSGPAIALDLGVLLGVAAMLAALQGGPLTDSLLDRLDGTASPLTGFHFDPVRLPSCRSGPASLACVLLSLGNLGLTPWLLPWAALRLGRSAEAAAREVLAAGCAAAYVVPFLFRYDYYDWNIQRLLTYASWTLAVLVAPLLAERLQAGGWARARAADALLLIGFQGLWALGVIVESSQVRDRVDRAFFRVRPIDERMMRFASALPPRALLLDGVPCLSGTACRTALLFGRYSASSRDRLHYQETSDSYRAARADPRPATLRRLGYTHVYVDEDWLASLEVGLAGAAFELVGAERAGHELRLLLRVCAPQERCALRVPDRF